MRITNRRQFLVYIAVVLGIVVLANLISRRVFFRIDLTSNKIYTLSPSSRAIISKLDDRMLAKVYFSSDLPGNYANNRRYLQDLLEEYQAYARGRFHFEFYRPEDADELEQEAQRYGIPPLQLQAIENDRMEIKNVWMGLALLYEDKRETIPVIQSTAGLEYDISSAIKKLVDTDKRTVALVADPAGETQNRSLQDLLRQTYTVRTVPLDSPIPPDIDLLMLSGVTDSLTVDALYNLDQYVMTGRPLFLAQGRVTADLSRGTGSEISTNLFPALEHYGVRINNNLLVDRISSQVAVETQRGIFRMRNTVNYPFFPRIQRFAADHLIVSSLEQVRLFFTSEVVGAIDSTRLGTVEFLPLLTTSEYTAVVPGPRFNLSHQGNPVFNRLTGPGRTAAGLLTGRVSSYFDSATKPEGAQDPVAETLGARIFVVGDGMFFADAAGGGIPENLNLVLNAVDFLVGDEALIALRNRTVTTRPLKELGDGTRRTVKWANILGPSALMMVTGLWRWSSNRRRRSLLAEAYGR